MAGFSSIVGHERVKEHLQNAIQMNKVSHAYIFNGEEKCGKKMIASVFAKTLQCEAGGSEPCGECHSCKQAESGNQPDIIYVTHEKPNTISVDDIRTQVNGDMQIKPYSSPYKVYIIEDAQLMNVQAQNAILKTIEEPPSYGIILLLTTNIDALLPTICSRCVVLNMKIVPDETIKNYLMTEYEIPDYKAQVCTAFAQGNVGKAVRIAMSDDFNEIKDEAIQLLKRIRTIELYELTEAVKEINKFKMEINDYFDIMTIWYRDVLLFKATGDANQMIFQENIMEIKKQSSEHSYEGIENILEALRKAKLRMKANVNFDLVIELLLLTIKEN